MQDGTFSRPFIFFAHEPDGSVAHVQLTTVQEGLPRPSLGDSKASASITRNGI